MQLSVKQNISLFEFLVETGHIFVLSMERHILKNLSYLTDVLNWEVSFLKVERLQTRNVNPFISSKESETGLFFLDREELERMFSGMPAVFTGMLQGEELSQAYASGDIFMMPSESETLGLVVLEAMSSGLPVVAARAGGIPDIIPSDQEGKTGYLFNPGDLEDCLSKLEPLLRNGELRETIGKAAREEMEKYDWRAATRKIRNEQYNAAIWFWRKKRAQLLRPIQWLAKRLFPSPEVNYRWFSIMPCSHVRTGLFLDWNWCYYDSIVWG